MELAPASPLGSAGGHAHAPTTSFGSQALDIHASRSAAPNSVNVRGEGGDSKALEGLPTAGTSVFRQSGSTRLAGAGLVRRVRRQSCSGTTCRSPSKNPLQAHSDARRERRELPDLAKILVRFETRRPPRNPRAPLRRFLRAKFGGGVALEDVLQEASLVLALNAADIRDPRTLRTLSGDDRSSNGRYPRAPLATPRTVRARGVTRLGGIAVRLRLARDVENVGALARSPVPAQARGVHPVLRRGSRPSKRPPAPSRFARDGSAGGARRASLDIALDSLWWGASSVCRRTAAERGFRYLPNS